jgi:hypothetical protein
MRSRSRSLDNATTLDGRSASALLLRPLLLALRLSDGRRV